MKKIIIFVIFSIILLSACQPGNQKSASDEGKPTQLRVLAAESFLADITQHITGERALVDTLIPTGVDPHAFEMAPKDVARIASSTVLVINGAGLEEWIYEIIDNAGGERLVIEASHGLPSRSDDPGAGESEGEDHHEGDPHFWLDPIHVIKYVENIRDGLGSVDPQGRDIYEANARKYIASLKELDHDIRAQVSAIPVDRRLMVTNHESFGYYADRYGFTVIGTIIPGTSTGSSPSAQQLARLIDQIRETGAVAIFLEDKTNPQLADQVARETGVKVITGLYTHSVTESGSQSSSYIDMMRHNTRLIVDALK